MVFYDLHVHTKLSIGENSIEDMVAMGMQLGLEGIAIVQYHDNLQELPEIDHIISAIILKPETSEELNTLANKFRNKCDLLLVHGGLYNVNRAACENPMIDILCHPQLGRKDSGIDHICAKAAHENNVAIEINMRQILESSRRHRIYVLSSMERNIKLCKKYGAPVITTSGAASKWGMRSGREMSAFAYLMGLELGTAIASTSTVPENMIKTNREKLAGKRWEGVRVL